MTSCHFHSGHSPSTHLAFCKGPVFCLLIKHFLISSCSQSHEILQLTSSTLSRLFQLGGDLEDLESALNKSSQTRPLGSGSCSALIKLLPNNKELLVSHDTWNTYQAMLRIMKKYIFAFKASPLGSLLMQVCFCIKYESNASSLLAQLSLAWHKEWKQGNSQSGSVQWYQNLNFLAVSAGFLSNSCGS